MNKASLYIFSLFLFIGCNTEYQKIRALENDSNVNTLTHFSESETTYYPNNYEGEWLLTSNLFDSLLTFKRVELSDSSVIFGKKFSFEEGSLKYDDFNPVPSCGNGMFYMDTCHYKIKDNYFTFNFSGGFMVESIFDYSAEYKLIDKNKKYMTLKRIVILKNDKKNF